MYIPCLPVLPALVYVYTISIILLGNVMNLLTAKTELKAKSPAIAPGVLAAEALVVVSFSIMLVGIFA